MTSYQELCTQFYDIDKPYAPKEALAFYLRYAAEACGPILEPMCGSGRFLIPMLERQFDIEGFDASRTMLDACRAHCKTRGLVPVLYEQTIERIDLPRKYGLVIIPASSLCLVTDQQQLHESLKRVFDLMLPGAKFVFEVELHKQKPSKSEPWTGRWVERPDGAKIIISSLGRYSAQDHILRSINRYDLVKDSILLQSEFEDFLLRYYDVGELTKTLETNGFQVRRLLTDYTGAPAVEADESIIVECSRPR